MSCYPRSVPFFLVLAMLAAVWPAAASPYGKLPLAFERNEGQADDSVRFLSRGRGYSFFLTASGAALRLSGPDQNAAAVQWEVVNGNRQARIEGESPLPGTTNYFIGNDPARWRTGVANYAKVRYSDVHPGIDLVYYGNQRQVEYDFVVAPRVDPRQIRLAFDGIESMRLGDDGALILRTAHGELVQPRPIVYQERGGKRHPIDGRYTLLGNDQIAFAIGRYDRNLPLVIDPVVLYSSYFGGSGMDQGLGITTDSSGNAYLAGYTDSLSFPGSSGSAIQSASGGSTDAYVSKINASGTAVVYSTFLGGSGGNEYAHAVKVDSSGNAYVTGVTDSTNFPGVTASSLQTSFAGGNFDAFLTKLNAAGNAITYSTYLGGSADDTGVDLVVDGSGNVYLTGSTASTTFPGVSGSSIQPANGGSGDVFLTKVNSTATAITYSTFLGGSGQEAPMSIARDSSNNVYLSGYTSSTSFPGVTGSSLQSSYGGGTYDAFATKINAAGSAITWSTYLGNSGMEFGAAIALDASNNVVIAGDTDSTSFPGVTSSSLQPSNAGGSDAFITRINNAATAILWSTFLGGNAGDYVPMGGMGLDSSGNVYVGGSTFSTSFTGVTGSSIQSSNGGSADLYVARVNAAGTAIGWATFYGSSGDDLTFAFAVDAAGRTYSTGVTTSTSFPGASSSAIQSAYAGGTYDAYVLKLGQPGSASLTSITPASGYPGTQVTLTGTDFGATQGSGNVWLGNKLAGSIVSWSNSQIVAVVAAGAGSGNAQVQQSGVWSNALPFTIIAPGISSITPSSGYPGTQVTINGTNFGATQGSGSVWLGNKLAGSIVSWSNSQIVAVVASGALSGSAQVQQHGVWSNAVAFTVVTPNITSITPTSGVAGTQVTITGTNFGAAQGSGSVWLGNKLAGSIVSWSNTQIVATVASGSMTGSAQVQQGGVWSNAVAFTVLTPSLTSISPTTARAGDSITITGTNFGATQGSGSVWLGNKLAASIVSWSNTQIVATVASGALSGTAQVQQGGVWSNAIALTVVTPSVGSISPASGAPGTQVTFTGTGFGATQGSGLVWIGTRYATVVSWSDTEVVATVAADAASGGAQVHQNGVWSNAITFTVTAAPPALLEDFWTDNDLIGGGVSMTGGVDIDVIAPAGGITVALASSHAAVTVPASVTIAEGQENAFFSVQTQIVAAITEVTLTATLGSSTQEYTITIMPPAVQELYFDEAQLHHGDTTSGTVVLYAPAAAGGAVVNLTSANPSLISVPATVTVPAGETEASFTATAQSSVATATEVVITAEHNGFDAGASLTVLPPYVASLSFTPSTVTGGDEVTATVTLSGASPADVEIEFDSTASEARPPGFIIPAGSATGQVTFVAGYVNPDVTAVVEAYIGDGPHATATLTVERLLITLGAVTATPSEVVGTNSSTVTVSLTNAAGAGGLEVDLSSGGSLQVPPFVVVPEGQSSVSFEVETPFQEPNSSTAAPVTGYHMGTTRTAWIGILPAEGNSIASLALAESRTAGGNLVTATITLAAPAGNGGAVISLSTSNSAVAIIVPASVTVPQGATSVTFDVDTDALVQPADVIVRAEYNSVIRKQRLTVVPTTSTVNLQALEMQDAVYQNDVVATVVLSGPAPAGGVVVTLGGSRTGIATVPASVTVPAGETSATFTITTIHPAERNRRILVTATYDGIVRTAPLTIIHAPE